MFLHVLFLKTQIFFLSLSFDESDELGDLFAVYLETWKFCGGQTLREEKIAFFFFFVRASRVVDFKEAE